MASKTGNNKDTGGIEQRVQDLIFICERLSGLLTKESAALEGSRAAEIELFLEEKSLLCRAYESRGRALLGELDRLADVDEEDRERLRNAVVEVEARMRVNTQRLAIEIEASRRFFDTLAQAAREHAPKSGVYSKNGTLAGDRVAAPKGIPLSVDQSL